MAELFLAGPTLNARGKFWASNFVFPSTTARLEIVPMAIVPNEDWKPEFDAKDLSS